VLVSSFDGPDGSPLYLVPGTPVQVGVLMDYAQAGQGTMDEVRIDGSVLTPPVFLVREPVSGALLGFGLWGLAARRRRAARRRGSDRASSPQVSPADFSARSIPRRLRSKRLP
jgi:hypothetical protein